MMYRQITSAERYALGVLRRQGLSAAAMARALGRHRGTIGREVRRNRAHADGSYRPQLADWYAGGRRARSRRNQRFTTPDLALVAAFLWEQWSPEQVVGYLRRHALLAISHETISRFIWAHWRHGGAGAASAVSRTDSFKRMLSRQTVLYGGSSAARCEPVASARGGGSRR